MSTEPNYSDESFDLDELEVESSDSPVFRFDGEKITDLSTVNIKKEKAKKTTIIQLGILRSLSGRVWSINSVIPARVP